MESNAGLAEKLNMAWRFFFRRGFIDGFGHISARTADANQILVSPHSLGGQSRPEDFVLADLSGRAYGNGALPGELPIHLEIYKRRPDVCSVAHFHQVYATSFSMSQIPLRPSYFLASIFRDGIPTHPDSRFVTDSVRGAALAATLGAHRAALIKAHGVAVVGTDIIDMVGTAFILEENAKRTWITASMGEPEFLDQQTMHDVEAEMLKKRGPFRRIWALCESEYTE